MKINIEDPAAASFPASNFCTVFCDGPNGVATSVVFWLDHAAMKSGEPPALRLDFESPLQILEFFSINLKMVTQVCKHLAGAVEARPAGH